MSAIARDLTDDIRWAAEFIRRELPASPKSWARADRLEAGASAVEQLQGAVAITDERIELAAKRLRLEYGWKTGDPDHTYRAIAKAMLEDAFGGQ